jgi:hypothetical protein
MNDRILGLPAPTPASLEPSAAERRFNRSQAERMVRRWNRRMPVGTPIAWQAKFGEEYIYTETTAEASVGRHGEPLVPVAAAEEPVSLFCVLVLLDRPAPTAA